MRISKKFLVLLCTVALIVSLMPMTALAATAYNSSIVSNTIPTTITPGQVVYAKVVVKNTGANTWTAARGIQLKETDSLKLLPYAYKLGASDSIKAGQSKTFTVKITAPATAGTYALKLRLYRGITAFGATLTKNIVVKSAVKTLASIAVTKQPTKTQYAVGEALDLAGLEVTGTYSDGTKAGLTIALADVKGFDSSKPAVDQVCTITKEGKTATFKVSIYAQGAVSANAISATQVLVKFNVELDKTSAETAGNYGGALAGGTVKLQADKKSVIVTTTAVLKGTNFYVVNPIKFASDLTKSTGYFSAVETYTDTVAPILSSIDSTIFSTPVANFSEPLSSTGAWTATQDGVSVKSSITLTWANHESAIKFDLSSVPGTSTSPIIVTLVGVLDEAGNLASPNPLTLTLPRVKTDVTAPTIVSIESAAMNKVKIVFSEKIGSADAALQALISAESTEAVPTAYTCTGVSTTDKITYIATLSASCATAIGKVTVANGYVDLSGNQQTSSKTVYITFSADNTAPKYVSFNLATFNSKQYLVLHYDEDIATLTGGTITGSVLMGVLTDDVNKVITSGGATPNLLPYNATTADKVDNKAVLVDITSWAAGIYSINIPKDFLQDAATNKTAAQAISFTKPGDTSAPSVSVDPTFKLNNTIMEVVFNKDMEQASALNLANYKIGSDSSMFTGAVFFQNQRTVRLTVKPNTIAVGGLYNITITGLKDSAGVAMAAYSKNLTVPENVQPYVASAKFSDLKTIVVNFSEAFKTGSTLAGYDIEVYKNGTKLTGIAATNDVVSETINVAAGTVTIVLHDNITSLTDAYTVKLVNTSLLDTSDNYVIANVIVSVAH